MPHETLSAAEIAGLLDPERRGRAADAPELRRGDWHGALAAEWAQRLRELLRDPVQATVDRVEATTMSQWLVEVDRVGRGARDGATPRCCITVRLTDELPPARLQLDSLFVQPMLDRLLGSSAPSPACARPLTRIESRLAAHFFEAWLDAAAVSGAGGNRSGDAPSHKTPLRGDDSADSLSGVVDRRTVRIAAEFTASPADPAAGLSSLAGQDGDDDTCESAHVVMQWGGRVALVRWSIPTAWRNALEQGVTESEPRRKEMAIVAEFGQLDADDSAFRDLQVGDVISLDVPAESAPVFIRTACGDVWTGQIGARGGHKAVRLLERLHDTGSATT